MELHPYALAVRVVGRGRLAAALGVSDTLIGRWYHKARRTDAFFQLPPHHCRAVEDATRECGHVVTRYELRPDVFGTKQEAAHDLAKTLLQEQGQTPTGIHG